MESFCREKVQDVDSQDIDSLRKELFQSVTVPTFPGEAEQFARRNQMLRWSSNKHYPDSFLINCEVLLSRPTDTDQSFYRSHRSICKYFKCSKTGFLSHTYPLQSTT